MFLLLVLVLLQLAVLGIGALYDRKGAIRWSRSTTRPVVDVHGAHGGCRWCRRSWAGWTLVGGFRRLLLYWSWFTFEQMCRSLRRRSLRREVQATPVGAKITNLPQEKFGCQHMRRCQVDLLRQCVRDLIAGASFRVGRAASHENDVSLSRFVCRRPRPCPGRFIHTS